jgi:hypothetical protein
MKAAQAALLSSRQQAVNLLILAARRARLARHRMALSLAGREGDEIYAGNILWCPARSFRRMAESSGPLVSTGCTAFKRARQAGDAPTWRSG